MTAAADRCRYCGNPATLIHRVPSGFIRTCDVDAFRVVNSQSVVPIKVAIPRPEPKRYR